MHFSDEIKNQLEAECTFSASRSSGPGGQNVNKVNTRVELRFSIRDSAFFSEHQKNILLLKLKNRINTNGELLLFSESERSQLSNRQKVIARFFELLEKELTPQKKRRKTRPTAASRLKRIENKKKQGEKKDRRKPPSF